MTSPFSAQNPGGGAARRGPLGLPTPPKGWPVGSYPTYAEAQKAVDYLSDNQFPVQHVTIVGVDEAVLLTGIASGAWLGVFIGLLLGMFTGNLAGAIVAAIPAGVLFGLITSAIPYWMSKGTRDFSSTMQLVAGRYDVLCDPQSAEQARDMLSRLTL